MKSIKTGLLFCVLSVMAGVGGAQVKIGDPRLPGSSPQSAVRLVFTSDIMIDGHINRWMRTHYPGWQVDPYQLMDIGHDRYAVVDISSANNQPRRVYFLLLQGNDDEGGANFP